MKGKLTIAAMALGFIAQGASASTDDNVYYINAPVVESRPIVTTRVERVPQESCRVVPHASRRIDAFDRDYSDRYRSHPVHDARYREISRDRYHEGDTVEADGVSTLIGGLIGGAIGRQFGSGSGRDAMTVVGAIAGASIASSASKDSRRYQDRGYRYDHRSRYRRGVDRRDEVSRTRCVVTETVREIDVVDGWQVTYLHAGKEYTRQVDQRPGSHIRLRVEVEPLVGGAADRRTI